LWALNGNPALIDILINLRNNLNFCNIYMSIQYIVDGQLVIAQYSNWESGHPAAGHHCVIAAQYNYWHTQTCSNEQRYVCQSE